MRLGAAPDALKRLLLVDHDPARLRSLSDALKRHLGTSVRITGVPTGSAALTALASSVPDAVVADLSALRDLGEDIESAVSRLVKPAKGGLVLVLGEGMSVSATVAAMRGGAHDFLAQPVGGQALSLRLAELAFRHGKRGLPQGAPVSDAEVSGFVGQSHQMQVIFDQIGRIAPSSAPVFITGESGTGKDVCARALHRQSARTEAPFIAVNCAAIPRDLMESELFGVMRGAYTGADADRMGAVEQANGGTLFLDEIGELDLRLQTKLLRFLQTGAITRVGEGRERNVDVRVVCATNRNPMQMIAEKAFREDLFYRLHVLPLHLPPLRQRAADIVPLAEHFLTQYAFEEQKHFARLSDGARTLLEAHEWPGNVRQLQNLIRRVVVMFEGEEVSPAMIETADIETIGRSDRRAQMSTVPEPAGEILPMWQQEQAIIEAALRRYSGNIAQAAAALQISPSTIYRKKQAWDRRDGGADAVA